MNVTSERIRARRIELGYSAEMLGEILGKSRATIYRYESDAIESMPLSIIQPLAKALRVSPVWLMGWTNDRDFKLNNLEQGKPMYVHEDSEPYDECNAPYCTKQEKQLIKGYRAKKEAQLAVRMLLDVK